MSCRYVFQLQLRDVFFNYNYATQMRHAAFSILAPFSILFEFSVHNVSVYLAKMSSDESSDSEMPYDSEGHNEWMTPWSCQKNLRVKQPKLGIITLKQPTWIFSSNCFYIKKSNITPQMLRHYYLHIVCYQEHWDFTSVTFLFRVLIGWIMLPLSLKTA